MNKLLLSIACAGFVSVPVISNAAPVTGSFFFVGREDLRVDATSINFGQFSDIFNTPIGDIRFTTGAGTFAGIGGSIGLIRDLSVPVNTQVALADFLRVTFTSDQPGAAVSPLANLNFTLTEVEGGVFPAAGCAAAPAAGQVCSPPNSPFNLFNTSATSFGVTVRVLGFVTNSMNERSSFSGDFSAQRTDLPFQGALLSINNPFRDDELGYFQTSYSADFAFTPESNPVPEPANMALMGLALSGAAFAIRRRKAQQ